MLQDVVQPGERLRLLRHGRDDPGDVLDDRLAMAIALLNMAVVRDVARHRCVHGVSYAGPWRRRMGS